jgi:hypothetical protein
VRYRLRPPGDDALPPEFAYTAYAESERHKGFEVVDVGFVFMVGPERDSVGGGWTLRAGLQPWSRQPPKRDRAEERSSRP